MLGPRRDHFSCLELMVLTPFYRLVGKGEDGPYVPKLFKEPNDAIVLYVFFFVVAIYLMDGIDVIVSCMIFR